jgi:hypothetical protein
MPVLAKAAGIGNLGERLPCLERCPAIEQAGGLIQTQ